MSLSVYRANQPINSFLNNFPDHFINIFPSHMVARKEYSPNCEILPGMTVPANVRRIALGVEYDGSVFRGFQIQPHDPQTVQQALHDSLSDIANEPISLVCAGRTDSGVHASGQVIHFDLTVDRPERAWTLGVNTKLPDQIAVKWAKSVDLSFHARFSAGSRTYRYIIQNTPARPGIFNKKVTWDKRTLDIQSMYQASQLLVGEHDFSSFRASQCQAVSPIRRVHYIDIGVMHDFIIIEIQANAFLHHMVRNIVGVLLTIGAGEKPLGWMQEVLDAKDRTAGGVTAPPHGLYLVHVEYPAHFAIPTPIPGPGFLTHPLRYFAN
ncbi:tRNA pseudouridine(38-40) synthase TruA [Sessilibacter sp. MAH4]